MFLNEGMDKQIVYNGTLFSNKRKKLFMQTIIWWISVVLWWVKEAYLQSRIFRTYIYVTFLKRWKYSNGEQISVAMA